MVSFKDKFTGAWMLTGKRRETYDRALMVDSSVAFPCVVLAFALSLTRYKWLSVLPLLIVLSVTVVRLLKRETLWQLKRLELQTGKDELKSMKQEMEKLISKHEK